MALLRPAGRRDVGGPGGDAVRPRRRSRCAAPFLGVIAMGLCGLPRPPATAQEAPLPDRDPAWALAHRQGPLSAEETRAFMLELAHFVSENHSKTRPDSPQRGMVYEYLDMPRRGEFDQFVQGEALDTMHDGAWFAAALVNAARATGDPYYRRLLTRDLLPFYCKMLNDSDRLFSAAESHARPGAAAWGREWALQEGEKGFVPYYWDDGGSVSIEMRRDGNPRPSRPALDLFVRKGEPNPRYLLNGYSHGSSNHLAQDLGVMLQQSWLLLRATADPEERRLVAALAQAARHLHQCRMNHHGHIPMCDAPTGLANNDPDELRRLPDGSSPQLWEPDNHLVRALARYVPGQRAELPGFADDQQYRYYFGLARHGGVLPRPLAFKTVYDAYTAPLLYHYYSDDAPAPAGINRFDLHPYHTLDGRLTDYRSDRRGSGQLPRPIGSRMGPQNMVCCGWALQALRADPALWEARYRTQFGADTRVYIEAPAPGADSRPPAGSPIRIGPLDLRVRSTRRALILTGASDEPEVTFSVCAQADGKGPRAEVFLKRDGNTRITNESGENLAHEATLLPMNPGFQLEVTIPYGVVRSQKRWLTPVDHSRLFLKTADETQGLYLAASTEQVRAWLAHELGAGLRTWQAIFRHHGYIPTGLGTGQNWDRYSDSGGYAHLISAASQWLLYQEGKRDWEVHQAPDLLASRPPVR